MTNPPSVATVIGSRLVMGLLSAGRPDNVVCVNLTDVLRSLPRALPSLLTDSVIVEVAPQQPRQFEHQFALLCKRVIDSRSTLHVLVFPDLRKQTQRATWVRCWNQRATQNFRQIRASHILWTTR